MAWETEFDEKTAAYLPDVKILREEPMSRHTSFRIGGPARRMAFPTSGEQLVLLLHFAGACGARSLVIGNGTNLLAADKGLDRLVVNTSAMTGVTASEDGVLTAHCGVSLARLADEACKRSLTGLEFAHGIPGTLGGAVCMNAGAYDGEMRQVVTEVTALFPETGVRTIPAEELDLGYRRSLFTDCPEAVVLGASVRLLPGDEETIRRRMRELMDRRRASQPLEWPSAGSTFKRPVGHFAGTLIQQCGLKGLTVGGAQVSEKHGGFLINRGGATFADMTALIARVQERVLAETGVRLEPEVKIVEA